METALKHPFMVSADFKPWEVEEVPLPEPTGLAYYSEKDAKGWCAAVKRAGWEGKAVVLSGGGGPGAYLVELHHVFPAPGFHADKGMYLGDKNT